MKNREVGDPAAFGERIVELISEGSASTTYKHALLLALIDVCLEAAGEGGEAPDTIGVRALAERVLGLYWPQTSTYPGRVKLLRQSGTGQAELVSRIAGFRARQGRDSDQTLPRAKRFDP